MSLHIHSVEITQAIQYYRSEIHLIDPSDQKPDNSMPLIAFKTCFVRVYIYSDEDKKYQAKYIEGKMTVSHPYPYTDGTIELSSTPFSFEFVGHGKIFIFQNLDDKKNYLDARSNPVRSVNFIIPAEEVFGERQLAIRIWSNEYEPEMVIETTVSFDANLRQTLKIIGIPVKYEGIFPEDESHPPLLATTLEDYQQLSADAIQMFPVQDNAEIEILGDPIVITKPLQTRDDWSLILDQVSQIAAEDQTHSGCWIYAALLPKNTPLLPFDDKGTIIQGLQKSSLQGTPVAAQYDGPTLAHEIGHALGLLHTPCCTPLPEDLDTNFPEYEPYKLGSIGEFGFDGIWPKNPSYSTDIMSYNINRWISLYSYENLLNHSCLFPEIHFPPLPLTCVPPCNFPLPPEFEKLGWRQEAINPAILTEHFWISGLVDAAGNVEVRNIFRAKGFQPSVNSTSDIVATLHGKGGKTIASASVQLANPIACCNGGASTSPHGAYYFKVTLPTSPNGNEIRLSRGDKNVWSRKAPKAPPKILNFDVKKNGNAFDATWECSISSKYQTEYLIRSSYDGGKSWSPLKSKIRETRTNLLCENLLAGSVLLQLVVNDGFYSTTSEPIQISIPARKPVISIVSPTEGAFYPAGATFRLMAMVTLNTGKPIDLVSLKWEINGIEVASANNVST